MGPAAKRRKLNQPAVEEVVFDPAARSDYLTGFHKRKVQRTKAAQEAAARRAREEKIEDRKKLREDRKAELEQHVRAMNALLPTRTPADHSEGHESDKLGSESDIETSTATVQAEPIDHEAEYIDEDKYTTVTVEEVDVSRHGLSSLKDDEDEAVPSSDVVEKPEVKGKQNPSRSKPRDKDKKSKRKKKAFRYESPADRKVNRIKEKAKKSKQARARRGD